jgi:hypothetical protein
MPAGSGKRVARPPVTISSDRRCLGAEHGKMFVAPVSSGAAAGRPVRGEWRRDKEPKVDLGSAFARQFGNPSGLLGTVVGRMVAKCSSS